MSVIKLCLLILFCLFFKNSFGQELSSIYKLYSPDKYPVLSSYGDNNYIRFTENTFVLFNFKNNEQVFSDSLKDEIFQVGMGTYTLTSNKLVLNFFNDSNLINHTIKDSISASFSSNNNTPITIKFKSKISVPYISKGFIVVETPKQKYAYNLDKVKDSVFITMPSTAVINSITLSILGFDKRILPYDYHFNNFNYYYEVRDLRSLTAIIENQTLEFNITSIKDGNYRFENNAYLKKCDKRQLDYFKNAKNRNVRVKVMLENMGIE